MVAGAILSGLLAVIIAIGSSIEGWKQDWETRNMNMQERADYIFKKKLKEL